MKNLIGTCTNIFRKWKRFNADPKKLFLTKETTAIYVDTTSILNTIKFKKKPK